MTETQVYHAASAALADAFGPKSNDLKVKVTSSPTNFKEKLEQGLTSSDLNAIIAEVGGQPVNTPLNKVIAACNQPNETPAKKKSLEETKKLIETFSDKLKNYPKYLTYEGAVVLCVMVSVNEGQSVNLNGMPQVDRELILSLLPPDAAARMAEFKASIRVEFDNIKDFILTYDSDPPVKLNFFNSVIHPQKLPDTNVPVENDGGKLFVGSALVLDQKRIQRLVGATPAERPHKDEEEELPRRQVVAGRNAYEIRADILALAVDFVCRNNKFGQEKSENDVLNLAQKFYTFVEDRRRR